MIRVMNSVVPFVLAAAPSLDAQTLTVRHTSADSATSGPTLAVYVDGNVKDAVGSSSTSTAVVSGALGLRYEGKVFTTSGQINVAAKLDTLATNFGTALLSPGSGKAFNSGLLDIRTAALKPRAWKCSTTGSAPWCRVGFHAYASASTTRWATSQQADKVTATSDVPVTGGGLGGYFNFFNGTVGNDSTAPNVAMVLDVNYALRHIGGDIASDSAALQNTIGTRQRSFNGLEIGLGLRYNQIRAGLTYYKMSGSVKGFSNGQIVAGFSLRADLLNNTFHEK